MRELAAGTLPLERFRFYVAQDLLFLDDYARAIGLAVGRARDERELRCLSEELSLVVEREIESERNLLERVDAALGRTRPEPVAAAPTTTTYASFLLAVAVRDDAVGLLTALQPCAWSYAEIGGAYRASEPGQPLYADWLNLYGGDEYVEAIATRRRQLDELLAVVPPRRRQRLSWLFTTATRLELAFWDMAYAEEER